MTTLEIFRVKSQQSVKTCYIIRRESLFLQASLGFYGFSLVISISKICKIYLLSVFFGDFKYGQGRQKSHRPVFSSTCSGHNSRRYVALFAVFNTDWQGRYQERGSQQRSLQGYHIVTGSNSETNQWLSRASWRAEMDKLWTFSGSSCSGRRR